jgi:diguanylate cyclase (GGDEF)-like protein/PAS domain S-box-containing protein
MRISYDITLTLLSLLMAFAFVGLGLAIVARFGTGWRALAAAGALAGSGIVAMHYTGMLAMRMPGVALGFRRDLVAASVAIAVIAATAALWLTFRTAGLRERLAAALAMGIAISGMHYTGMAAATFEHIGQQARVSPTAINEGLLALAIAGATSLLLILGLLGAFFDRKLAALTAREAQLLRESERRFRTLVESASEVIIVVLDPEGRITYESGSAAHVLGYSSAALIGRPLADLAPEASAPEFARFLARIGGLLPGQTSEIEVPLVNAAGGVQDFEVVARNLVAEPTVGGVVAGLRDISERKRLTETLERLSQTDQLTATLNRRGFLTAGDREMARARRSGRSLPIVMIDLDHFKKINDTYGHAAGDLVLTTVAEICRTHIRSTDVLSRFGGEEFAILLVDGETQGAHQAVERLRLAIEAARVNSIRGEVRVTASFGLAIVDPQDCDLELAVRLADDALYEAKNAGRNCIRMHAIAS